ncbi:hypothetical protein SAMN05216241_103253 [Limimonas halophila]|uniref:Tetratricopeptide repeat-containing protein n=1 Tax=Limimonas halophila TaxID=1082479 RepID=A0A1G7Q654_9PROT|nr:tetratricopeptide repeat protein [Limimonas halophila]SDF94067.1 hypothetical protein SAMN05216241_103253 [Limimonas halophila]
MTRAGWIRIAAPLAAALALLASGARAAEIVNVSGTDEGAFGRLVFEWSEPVSFRAFTQNRQLKMEFGRRATFQTDDAYPALTPYIGAAAPGPHGYRVSFPLKGDYAMEGRRDGKKVIITLRKPGAPPPGSDTVTLDLARRENADRLIFDWPKRVPYAVGAQPDQGRATIQFTRKAPIDTGPFEKADPRYVEAVEVGENGTGSVVKLTTKPGVHLEHRAETSDVVVDVFAPGVKEDPPPPEAVADDTDEGDDTATQTASAAPPRPVIKPDTPESFDRDVDQGQEKQQQFQRFSPNQIARGLIPQPGDIPPRIGAARVRADWARGPAALYRRDGSVWFVVPGRAPPTFPQRLVRDATAVTEAELVRNNGGVAVLRMGLKPQVRARARRPNEAWRIRLAPEPVGPSQPLDIQHADGQLKIPVRNPGDVVTLDDPGAGGRIHVVPTRGPGQGVPVTQAFPTVTVLRTALGVVVVPKADGIEVATTKRAVLIGPGGEGGDLHLSDTAHDASNASPLPEPGGEKLLQLAQWRRPGRSYPDAQQDLESALASAPPAEKHLARLDLARFYFAHGFGVESLGALDIYTEDAGERGRDPQVRLMRGGSHVLADNWRKAGRTLAHPALDSAAEALPWRAAYANATGAHRMAAEAFHMADPLIDAYPKDVRLQLRLWSAESRLALGQTEAATAELDAARSLDPKPAEKAEIKYLKGRKQLVNGQVNEAEKTWRSVAEGPYARSRGRARFVMVERDLAAGRIDVPEAIDRLEKLRFAWRGDTFEAILLHRLADLYLQNKQYARALRSLQDVANHLSGLQRAELAAKRMRDIFQRLFLGGEADKLNPLDALTIYEQFRELTPAGERGNRMLSDLVDRLVNVDLLDSAAKLLGGQVDHRLSGTRKAMAGARLASVRLLNRQPGRALDALERSSVSELSPELKRRRRHLRVRALSQQGKRERALSLLSGDDSTDGLRLKADIWSDNGEWSKAATALLRLVPEPPAAGESLDAAGAQKVVRAAVALTMAGDQTGLKQLRGRYGRAITGTQQAETFKLLTDSDATGLDAITEQLDGVDNAVTFLDAYRKRVREQAEGGGSA